MNELSEYIEQKDMAFTELTLRELRTLNLVDLVRSRSPFWYQSQTEGSAGQLIAKIIDAKLTAADEAFAQSMIAELTTGKGAATRQEYMTELGRRANIRRRATETASIHAANRLLSQFVDEFCTQSCAINWAKICSFVDRQAA